MTISSSLLYCYQVMAAREKDVWIGIVGSYEISKTILIIALPSHCYQAMAAIDKDEPGKKFWLHTRSGLGVHCHTYTVLFTIIVCVYIVTMNIIVMVVLAASLSFSPYISITFAMLIISTVVQIITFKLSVMQRLEEAEDGWEGANCLFTSWLVHCCTKIF